MSRSFNGGIAADFIRFAAGSATPDEGPSTMAVLAKCSSLGGFTGWMIQGTKAGSPVWAILTSNNGGPKLFIENDFTAGVPGLTLSWAWYIAEKAPGSVVPRWHIGVFVDATTISWTHQNGAGNVNNLSGPIDALTLGLNSVGNTWRGSEAVAATWASQPFASDAAVEAAFTHAAADAFNAGPGWMVRLNQASTATPITDDTGGGGDQSAISGTAVDADDPPGFNYALTVSPSEGSAGFLLGLAPAAQGARTSAGAAALSLGMAPAATGARVSAGTVAGGLSLGIDVDGERDSLGSAALGLGLAPAATGARSSSGSAAVGLNLALAAHGAGEVSCLPFPWECGDLPAFPGTCSPVPSFSEVTP